MSEEHFSNTRYVKTDMCVFLGFVMDRFFVPRILIFFLLLRVDFFPVWRVRAHD